MGGLEMFTQADTEARKSLRLTDQFMRRHLHGLAHTGHGRATIVGIQESDPRWATLTDAEQENDAA
jgi:hypothetical protein